MTSDPNDPVWPPSYNVGYGKPPENRRFVKGKSGNPHGRPSKNRAAEKRHFDSSTMENVLKVALREVTAREGETISTLSAIEAVLQTMLAKAIKGDVPAQKSFVDLYDKANKQKAAEISADHQFWKEYPAIYDKYTAALREAGKPVPDILTYPDDLVFEENCPVTIRGGDPTISAQNRCAIVRLRDILILQSEQDARSCSPKERRHHQTIFVSHYLLEITNACLPERMRLSDIQIIIQMSTNGGLRKSTLEHRLKAGWAELGVCYQRGMTTAPMKPILLHLGIDLDAAKRLRSAYPRSQRAP